MLSTPAEDRVRLAEKINSLGLSWTASSYTDIDTDAKSFAQVNTKSVGENTVEWFSAFANAQYYLHHPDQIGADELPDQFTWEDFEGFNFVGDVADQGACGSCYVVASTTMLESRIMLYYGEKHDLSAQFPLQCSFMNEGCHGGWGLFNGMFLESYYTVDRDEAPYRGSVEFGGCHNFRHLQPKAKVAETYYVGGHYGGMSEHDMMWELRAKGPFLLDFNAGQAFQLYKSGVLTQDGYPRAVELLDDAELKEELISDSPGDEPNTMTSEDYGIQYEYLTHSTVLIGWGTEKD